MWEISPNPGKIRMYTSGCPKNQNKCWYKIGSPPPTGSKNVVFRFRSVRSIVRAAANTGREKASKNDVISTDHTNKGVEIHIIPDIFILKIVTIKLIAPKIEEAPAMWSLRIPQSTATPSWYKESTRGGYTVQPVPTPDPTVADMINRDKEGGSNQNLMLFSRG